MNRFMQRILLFLLILVPMGCSDSTRPSESTSSNTALFDPTTNTVPLPNILATATAKDPITQYTDPATGLVGPRPANTPMNPLEALAYLNLHEAGGSGAVAGVNAPIYLRFAAALDPATVNGANIKVFQLTPDGTSPSAPENRPLGFTDVTGLFSFSYSAGSSDLSLFPNFPLLPGTRYLYLVTDRVKDAATGAAVSGSVYFDALKSPLPLAGPFAALEPIRANTLAGGNIALSGYAKVMDDLIAAAATTTVASRNQIALLGRFITTSAGFIARDPANPVASLIPVESALRAFALGGDLGGLTGKNWLSAGLNGVALSSPGSSVTDFWATWGAGSSAPSSVAAVVTGSFTSADISMNPVVAHNNSSMNLNVPPGTYDIATSVVQPFRDGTGQLTGFYYTQRTIPFVYFVPAAIPPAVGPPAAGWPLVVFQHGINGRKEQAVAVAGALTAAGFGVLAIDLPLHGELAAPGHQSGALSSELWGQDFIALGAPLAARSNIQQAAFNLDRLEFVVKTQGFAAPLALATPTLAGNAPNPLVTPKYLSLSLGSIVGAYYLAGNTTLRALPAAPYDQTTLSGDMKGLLNVAGGRIAYLLRDSVSFGPSIDAGLAAKGIAKGTPDYLQFFLLTQSVLDPVDPATMTTPLPNLSGGGTLPSRLSGRILVQEATSSHFDASGLATDGDLVIPNSSTRYFGNALGGRGVLGTDVAPGFAQVTYASGSLPSSFMLTLSGPKTTVAARPGAATGPAEGYFQFNQTDVTHGFLISPVPSLADLQLAQGQMVAFLLTGIVVDPTAPPVAAARLLSSTPPGGEWQPTAPPAMQIFGYPDRH